MARKFTKNDGLVSADIVHCALDHLSAAQTLFESSPSHYDSAGYLAHIGVEMLLKGWLLETCGVFEGIHNLNQLYSSLIEQGMSKELDDEGAEILAKLDEYEKLRYPNLNAPVEVGDSDWDKIENLVGDICRAMPAEIEQALDAINSSDKHKRVRKAGRVLMKKRKNVT